ncbi:hypothetical protein D3C81_1909050 [compost metagenome]
MVDHGFQIVEDFPGPISITSSKTLVYLNKVLGVNIGGCNHATCGTLTQHGMEISILSAKYWFCLIVLQSCEQIMSAGAVL